MSQTWAQISTKVGQSLGGYDTSNVAQLEILANPDSTPAQKQAAALKISSNNIEKTPLTDSFKAVSRSATQTVHG